MKKKISIIVGGSGQLGISLIKILLKKKFKVVVTTRDINKARKKVSIKNKNLKFVFLNVLKKNKILFLLKRFKPNYIYYFAGQSSPVISYKKNKVTYLSNVKGCQNFLEIINLNDKKIKFINASSSEIFSDKVKKIKLSSKKIPISPYGKAKLISFNKTKFFREKKNLKAYNSIIFNSESYFREKSFLIPKICLAAIKAKKFKKKTSFGNLDVSREWNWCDEQTKYLVKFVEKEPQDFILSNGKSFTARQMMSYAFNYFNLNYKSFITFNKSLIRPKDFLTKKSEFKDCLKRNGIKRKSKIYGKRLIHALIKYYLDEKKI